MSNGYLQENFTCPLVVFLREWRTEEGAARI